MQTKDTARQVLQEMQEAHTENLPVLDGKQFKFFANRGEILANLISKFILKEQKAAEEDQASSSSG